MTNYHTTLSAQIGNVVTIQTASVQEQLQRIQQLREQQQQKKRQAAEAKREQALNAASQSDIIQKQVCMCSGAVAKSSISVQSSPSSCHQRIHSHQDKVLALKLELGACIFFLSNMLTW